MYREKKYICSKIKDYPLNWNIIHGGIITANEIYLEEVFTIGEKWNEYTWYGLFLIKSAPSSSLKRNLRLLPVWEWAVPVRLNATARHISVRLPSCTPPEIAFSFCTPPEIAFSFCTSPEIAFSFSFCTPPEIDFSFWTPEIGNGSF